MLRIVIPATELFNNKIGQFVWTKEQVLVLEHSLVSLSKWESKWKKPFMTKTPKSIAETVDYIRCMTITQNVDEMVYLCLNQKIINEVNEYIEDSMTATTFSKENRKPNNDVITAEIVYYWMVALNIPFECQKWHLNRLLTLINVCNIKSQPQKKMSKKQVLARNRALNNARRKSMHTAG